MLYQNVSKYGLATHLALAAALPAALAQFVSNGILACTILWVSLIALFWFLMEPSVFSGETVSGARSRVVRGVLKDPIAWFFLFAILFAFVRWLNSGVRLVFDAEKSIWSVAEAAIPFLPASSGSEGFLPLALAVAIAVVVLGVKHALGRNARLWFGIFAGAISATGALAAVICAGLDMAPFNASALSGFGAISFPGSMFAMFLLLTVACGIEAEGRGMTKARLVFAWGVAGNVMGSFVFLPSLLSIAYLSLSVIVAVIELAVLKRYAGAATTARAASMIAFGVIVAVFVVMMPQYSDIQAKKSEGFDVEKAFPPALSDRNEALCRIAKVMWLEQPWAGVGVGAFGMHAQFCASKEDWTVLPPDPKEGSNGYFTIIAERGIVGAIVWVVAIGLLVWFWVSRLIGSFVWQKSQDEGRSWLLNVPVVVWVGPLVMVSCLADAWFSASFSRTPLPLCAVAAMVLGAASFPKVKKIKSVDKAKKE